MKAFVITILWFVSSLALADQSKVLFTEVEMPVDAAICNTVYTATKAIAENLANEYVEYTPEEITTIGEAFARSVIGPLTFTRTLRKLNDGEVNKVASSLFIRKNLAILVGNVGRYRDMKMSAEDISVKVGNDLFTMCSRTTTFHVEPLFIN